MEGVQKGKQGERREEQKGHIITPFLTLEDSFLQSQNCFGEPPVPEFGLKSTFGLLSPVDPSVVRGLPK